MQRLLQMNPKPFGRMFYVLMSQKLNALDDRNPVASEHKNTIKCVFSICTVCFYVKFSLKM